MTNIVTALGRCFTTSSLGNTSLNLVSTEHAGTAKQENLQSKIRKSIDTSANKVRVVSTP